MSTLRDGFEIYSCYVRKMGAVEMLRREVWEVIFYGSKAVALRVIMHFVHKAEKKIQETEKEREE